jgi:hypothetical protein
VLAYNVISSAEGPRSRLFRSLYRTAQGVWGHVWAFPIGLATDGNATGNRNIVVLASDADVSPHVLLRRISTGVDGHVKVAGFRTFGADLYSKPVPVTDAPVLTDAYAPTDSLIDVR